MIEWRRGKYHSIDTWLTLWHRVVDGKALCGIRKPSSEEEFFKSDSLYPGDVCEKCDQAE